MNVKSPFWSLMQKFDPSRIVIAISRGPDDPRRGRLRQRLDDELVDVDVLGPRDGEEDALGDVRGGERLDAFVDLLRPFLVAAEPDLREARLDEPRVDRRQVDRATEEVLAQRIRESADRELRGDVDRGVLVRLPPGHGAEVDDVPAVADVRDAEARHAHQAEDVRLDHRLLVLVGRLPERVASEAEAGVVDEDVEAAELGHGTLDEALGARAVGDVQLESDQPSAIQLLDPARPNGDLRAGVGEHARGRRPDPARGARDDRRLAVQRSQDAEP